MSLVVAITGGNGFIGKQLVSHHIQQKDQVRLLSRNPLLRINDTQTFVGDLTNQDVDLSSFLDNVDILYHCAGEINNAFLMQDLHINGTQRLVDAAQGKIGRWVQLSSVGAYGVCRDGIITEDSKERPFGIYERTKGESDKIVKNSGIPCVILRPSNVFGNNMPNQSLKSLLWAVRKGLFFFIGKKNESLVNYVHIADVVNALICCGSNDEALGRVFNLSQSTTVEKMITSFASGMKSSKKILRFPEGVIRVITGIFGWAPGFPLTSSRINALTGRCVYNSTKIQKILEFKYSMTLEEGFVLFAKQK
jgi:nucleoside-diphosphate-sugar epimerase